VGQKGVLGAHGLGSGAVFGSAEGGALLLLLLPPLLLLLLLEEEEGSSSVSAFKLWCSLCKSRQPSGWFSICIIALSVCLCSSSRRLGFLITRSVCLSVSGSLRMWPSSGFCSSICRILGSAIIISRMNSGFCSSIVQIGELAAAAIVSADTPGNPNIPPAGCAVGWAWAWAWAGCACGLAPRTRCITCWSCTSIISPIINNTMFAC